MMKNELRPLYSELQGYLSQAPSLSNTRSEYIYNEPVWTHYNGAIELLNQISKKDYSRFFVEPQAMGMGGSLALPLVSYRQKLGGLINTLHAEYFSDEQVPFSGSPSTVISQTQQQGQSLHVQVLLDFQSKIDVKIHDYEDGSKEKGFLEKIKSSLGSIPNVMALLQFVIKTAKDCGLSLGDILSVLF